MAEPVLAAARPAAPPPMGTCPSSLRSVPLSRRCGRRAARFAGHFAVGDAINLALGAKQTLAMYLLSRPTGESRLTFGGSTS